MNRNRSSADDRICMAQAVDLAKKALACGEFPVGCVIADENGIIARGHRLGTATGNGKEIDHAELNALRQLCTLKLDANRSKMTLYTTMEPCLMCYAAILLSGIQRIVYAYEDIMGGATGLDRSGLPALYRDARLRVVSGVLRKESLTLFRRFFANPQNAYWADSPLSRHVRTQAV